MKKYLIPLFFFALFFYFHPAKAATYFSQPNSNGYSFSESIPFGHHGLSYLGDDSSYHPFGINDSVPFIADFSGYGSIYGGSLGSAFPYPIATTSATSYVSDIILEIRDSNQTENADYAITFTCYGADGNSYLGNFTSGSVNSSTFSGDFTSVDFPFTGANCDLSKNQLHSVIWNRGGPTSATPIEVRLQNANSIAGFGVADDNGNIFDGYEPQITIKSGTGQPSKTPILIIPGVLGSELYNGSDLMWADLSRLYLDGSITDLENNFMVKGLKLDDQGNSIDNIKAPSVIEKVNLISPIPDLHFFDFLIQDFEQDGYIRDFNLFSFPYDWRLDLEQTKDLLNQKIEKIKQETGAQKVDIIAHSMGGLLAKDYLNTYGKNSVDKLIFVGTPHLGAPKAAKVLLQGDRFGIPWLNEDIMKMLSQNSPASHELLPSPSYFSQYQGYIKPYKFFESSPFLQYGPTEDFINSKSPSATFANSDNFFSENLQDMDFNGIRAYNIAGCKTGTEAGYSLAIGNNIIGGVGYVSGDGTVPLPSADYINIPGQNKFYVRNADHSSLPSMDGVRDLISGILKDQITLFTNVSNNNSFCNFKGKTLSWHSPVDVNIYSNGQHTGPIQNGIEYGIPGVSYDIIGHDKFIYLPTDDGQTYDIEASGTASATFDLQISSIDNGTIQNTFVYNDVPVSTGTPISFGVSDNSADSQILVNSQPQPDSSQLTGNQAQDLAPPQSTTTVSGTLGNDRWYKSNVQVALTATDDSSGVLVTKYSIDNGAWQNYATPFIISNEGAHTISYYSIDKAGNDEDVNSLNIKIDKTAPEFIIQFNTITKDFDVLTIDNLDSNPTKICTLVQCTAIDAAGNTTILTFQKQNLPLNIKNLILKSISYNGKASSFDTNILTVAYTLLGGNVADLTQTELIKNQQLMNVIYINKKNQSTITDLTKDSKPQITMTTGVKILQTLTNNSKIKINIK